MDEDGLGALLREHAKRHAVPGAALGVLHQDVAIAAYHGIADVSTGERVTADTRFSVGSLTKTMSATVISRLARDGRLSLDDPVASHVPELHDAAWARTASLRDLLANRSGLPLRSGLEFGFDRHPDRDDGALARLAAELAAESPTTDVWSYSNVGWCLVGRVIETATKGPWEHAMQQLLFDPIEMTGTASAVEAVPAHRAAGYEVTPNGAAPVPPMDSRAYGPAGTTVVSTLTDLLRFAALHLRDPSLAALREVQAAISIHGWLDAWCLGMARFAWGAVTAYGWDGLLGGERSFLRILPEHQAAVVLLANGSTGRSMYRSLIRDLMGAWLEISVPPLRLDPTMVGPMDLSRYAGVYAWPDSKVSVTAGEHALTIKTDEGGETGAMPLDARTFLVDRSDPDNPTVTFGEFDGEGRPRALYLMLWAHPRR